MYLNDSIRKMGGILSHMNSYNLLLFLYNTINLLLIMQKYKMKIKEKLKQKFKNH